MEKDPKGFKITLVGSTEKDVSMEKDLEGLLVKNHIVKLNLSFKNNDYKIDEPLWDCEMQN